MATGLSTGTNSLVVQVEANAGGQNGGYGDPSIGSYGGAGGSANSTANATGAGSDVVSANAQSSAGEGGLGSGGAFTSGVDGNATADASALSTGVGPVTATAGAYSQLPAATVDGFAPPGSEGGTVATATATGAGRVSSTAVSQGSSGNATAESVTPTGLISFMQCTAIAPADRIGNAQSVSLLNTNQSAPAVNASQGYDVGALMIGSPIASDVTAAWASDLGVLVAFNNVPSNVNVLMHPLMQYDASGSGAVQTYSTTLEVNESNSQLTGNGLILGLLTPDIIGAGLQSGDSFRFRMQRQGNTIVDQTFATNAALSSYFQDALFDLGPENAGLGGANLDLKFLFDLTTTHPGSGIDEPFLLGSDSNAQVGTWAHPIGGSWAAPSDWSANTLPDGPGVQATFGAAISAPQTVTLDENTTVGSIQFNNSNSYNIAPGTGGNSLTLDNAGAGAAINVSLGNHSISAPIVLTSPGLGVSLASGSTLTASGKISGTGPLTITGAGTFKLGPSIGEVDLTGLSIAAGCTLDLNNNHIILSYSGSSPISSIAGYLQTGYNNGAWNGPGIDSSAAAATSASYGIGYADAADPGNPAGLSSGTIEIEYTLLGDADLNGIVNGLDFGILAANFNKGVTGWDKGDFDYNDVVNGIDFADLAKNFNKGAAGASVGAPAYDDPVILAFATANGLLADVPEPASTGLFAIGTVGFLAKRRRR